jgi:ATP-dependent RNA helicase DDX35
MDSSLSSSSDINKNSLNLGIMNDHIENILVTISQHPVTNVIALSGSGKTTKLPLGIANANNKITVVVSGEGLAESLNNYIGDGNLTYVSQHTMKQQIYKIVDKGGCLDLDFSDILMIDQADTGSVDQFLIMGLWKYCAERNFRVPRLLLVSNTPITSNQFEIEHYKIDTDFYPAEIRYSDKNYPIRSENNVLLQDTSDLVFDLHTSSTDGDMLIFTTGKLQMESVILQLESLQMERVDIYPAHQDLTQGEVDRIYQTTLNRKIIVADKSAETSFVPPNLKVIIDLMTDKRLELSLTGGQRYNKRYISKAQANLRASRGSSNGSVLCYRMIRKSMYLKLLDKISPEIYRVPLHNTMLELIQHKIDPLLLPLEALRLA